MRFCLYSVNHDHITLDDILPLDCIARVEESGSEGYYVEVVRYSNSAGTYMRFAHQKFFELAEAVAVAEQINANDSFQKCFHTLPNWEE